MTPELRVPICLLGPGTVGRALLAQLVERRSEHAERWGIHMAVAAVADHSAILVGTNGEIDTATLEAVCALKTTGRPLSAWVPEPGAAGATRVDGLEPARIERLGAAPILVDCTAADTTASLLDARSRGWRLVLANKIPLTGPIDAFRSLTRDGAGARWETTVASALPVVATLQALCDQGDTVRWITGTLSGTLGMIAERLGRGDALSATVRGAVASGLCEPDPRTDLSGDDVARKALILGRMAGMALELADVAREALYPAEWNALEAGEFIDRLPECDAAVAGRFADAARLGAVLRYQATAGEGRIRAEWTALDPDATVARAGATNSCVIFETERYTTHPVVIAGRAGGPRVTAAGVLGDLVALARA